MINCLSKKIKNIFENLEKIDLKIMKIWLKICAFVLLISVSILAINLLSLHTFFYYNIGILLLKLSLYLSAGFIICGIIVDGIKNQNL